MLAQKVTQVVMGNFAGLFESSPCFACFFAHKSVMNNVAQVMMLDDARRDVSTSASHMALTSLGEWCLETRVTDVGSGVFAAFATSI